MARDIRFLELAASGAQHFSMQRPPQTSSPELAQVDLLLIVAGTRRRFVRGHFASCAKPGCSRPECNRFETSRGWSAELAFQV